MKKSPRSDEPKTDNVTFRTETGPIAVIGAGVVGASWAGLFAAYGKEVRLHDKDAQCLEAGVTRAEDNAQFLVEHNMVSSDLAELGLKSLSPITNVRDAVEGVVLVQEAVLEDIEIKKKVFNEIDRFAPRNALLITSSSGLSISKMQSDTRFPDRCLAGHPYNPPHIMPLIEIAFGERTVTEAVMAAKGFYETLGKVPIILNREVPGYLGNRMSAALWREAVNLALSGVASVEDIDKAIRYGPGLRWSVLGPHMTYHLGGGKGGIRYHTEHLLKAKEKIWADLDDWKTFPLEALDILMEGLPDPNTTSSLSRERDEALIRVMKALSL